MFNLITLPKNRCCSLIWLLKQSRDFVFCNFKWGSFWSPLTSRNSRHLTVFSLSSFILLMKDYFSFYHSPSSHLPSCCWFLYHLFLLFFGSGFTLEFLVKGIVIRSYQFHLFGLLILVVWSICDTYGTLFCLIICVLLLFRFHCSIKWTTAS